MFVQVIVTGDPEDEGDVFIRMDIKTARRLLDKETRLGIFNGELIKLLKYEMEKEGVLATS